MSLVSVYRTQYRTTLSNLRSGFHRSQGPSPTMHLTIDEWVVWKQTTPQTCHYCGLPQDAITKVGMTSQIKRPVKYMGVDRLDSSVGYTPSNMVPCCFSCNRIKSDRFSAAEMQTIGASLAEVWQGRLLCAGVEVTSYVDGGPSPQKGHPPIHCESSADAVGKGQS